MSEQTFLSFIILEGRRIDAQAMARCFRGGLAQVLAMEGYSSKKADEVADSYLELILARTASASLATQVSHLARDYKHLVRGAGGLERCDIGELIGKMNHRPRKSLNFATPVEATREVLNARGAGAKGTGQARATPPLRIASTLHAPAPATQKNRNTKQ